MQKNDVVQNPRLPIEQADDDAAAAEPEFGAFAEIGDVGEGVRAEHETYVRVKGEYLNMLENRDRVNRNGVIFIAVSAVVFLTLMFSLESKLIFLVLWIITIIFSVAYLIHNEYKIYKLRLYLGYETEDSEPEEENEDEPEDEPTVDSTDFDNTAEIDITNENSGESGEDVK